MLSRKEYIAENAQWLDERVHSNLEQIEDSAWPAVVAAAGIITGGDGEPGIDCDVVITAETLSDFEASRSTYWSERGTRKDVDCAGCKAVLYENFQRAKGARRTTILVLDAGGKRIVLQ